MKPLLKIIAKHKISEKSVEMEYASIKQAKFFNKDFICFRVVGFADKKQTRFKKNERQ